MSSTAVHCDVEGQAIPNSPYPPLSLESISVGEPLGDAGLNATASPLSSTATQLEIEGHAMASVAPKLELASSIR